MMEFILVKLQVYFVQIGTLLYTNLTKDILNRMLRNLAVSIRIFWEKSSMMYHRLNKVAILPKTKLMLDF